VAAGVVGAVILESTMAVLQFNNLTLAYARHPVLHHVHTEIQAGSLTAIVGPNGSGKSTLLKAIMGEVAPVGGSLRLHRLKKSDIGYLPQLSSIERRFPLSVQDFLLSGLWSHCGAFAALPANTKALVQAALAKVGLLGFAQRHLQSLSGGQMQRLLFARLLLQDKPLVLLDEPFNAIDAKTVADLLRLIQEWHGQARTILVVTHDLEQVRSHFPDTLLLARELVQHGKTQHVLTAANLLQARRMCEAFVDDAAVCEVDQARQQQS
jgi:zinc/manganese transport system ATP-binding protein